MPSPSIETPAAVVTTTKTEVPPTWASQPSSGPGLGSLILPMLVLGGMAFLAVWLRQRRPKMSRYVEVLETTGLGPKRQLIVARLGEETLVLGASEAGITLLATRPFEQKTALDDITVMPEQHPVLQLFKRKPKNPESFESLMADTAEDEELRAKLAQGRAGRVL